MKRSLLLLSSLILFAPQSLIAAENYYLVWSTVKTSGVVPMETLDACENAGITLKASSTFTSRKGYVDQHVYFACISGKDES